MGEDPGVAVDGDEAVLEETLDALEMPREGLATWIRHDRAFCEGHGGRRVYGEILAILDECERALGRRGPRA